MKESDWRRETMEDLEDEVERLREAIRNDDMLHHCQAINSKQNKEIDRLRGWLTTIATYDGPKHGPHTYLMMLAESALKENRDD